MIQYFTYYNPNYIDDDQGGYLEGRVYSKQPLQGYLDLLSGSNRNFNKELGFVEEATHVLIVPMYNSGISDETIIESQDTGKRYRVTYVDNPVGVNHHLEIYLKEL